MKWTKAQQSAIEDRGGTLLVSAAAGSGKTAVLTQRVVSLLCDGPSPIPADRILAVTFTRAAAAQLRARIAAALAQRAAAQPGSAFLKRQKLLFGARGHLHHRRAVHAASARKFRAPGPCARFRPCRRRRGLRPARGGAGRQPGAAFTARRISAPFFCAVRARAHRRTRRGHRAFAVRFPAHSAGPRRSARAVSCHV